MRHKMHLKLSYRKVEFNKFSGGYTPRPPLQGEGRGWEGEVKGGELDPTFETVPPPLL